MAALLEKAAYAPANARYKVYMIDEVHQLSNHAFNAMLKTLEEPPEPKASSVGLTTEQKPMKTPAKESAKSEKRHPDKENHPNHCQQQWMQLARSKDSPSPFVLPDSNPIIQETAIEAQMGRKRTLKYVN